jgi:hypothetical protein
MFVRVRVRVHVHVHAGPTMGGLVSRDKVQGKILESGKCAPVHFVVANEWLTLSGMPVTRAHMDTLYSEFSVRTVATLTLTPLQGMVVGDKTMVLNCSRSDGGEEWMVQDTDMLSGCPADMRLVHVPIPDSCPLPTENQFACLVQEAEAARATGHRLHVHCWKGQGRAIVVAGLLCAVLNRRCQDKFPKTIYDWSFGVKASERLYANLRKAIPSIDDFTVEHWLRNGWPHEVRAHALDCGKSELETTIEDLTTAQKGRAEEQLSVLAATALEKIVADHVSGPSVAAATFLQSRAVPPPGEEDVIGGPDDDDDDDDERTTQHWVIPK